MHTHTCVHTLTPVGALTLTARCRSHTHTHACTLTLLQLMSAQHPGLGAAALLVGTYSSGEKAPQTQ